MTQVVTEEQIDKTQWLPKDAQVILPEQERFISQTEGERGGRQYHSSQEPLARYLQRRNINRNQYVAGCRLQSLWKSSLVATKCSTMRFGDQPGNFDRESMLLTTVDYFKAMEALEDFHTRRIVRMVCCFGEPSGGGRSMELLKSGLDALMKHFQH